MNILEILEEIDWSADLIFPIEEMIMYNGDNDSKIRYIIILEDNLHSFEQKLKKFKGDVDLKEEISDDLELLKSSVNNLKDIVNKDKQYVMMCISEIRGCLLKLRDYVVFKNNIYGLLEFYKPLDINNLKRLKKIDDTLPDDLVIKHFLIDNYKKQSLSYREMLALL